MHIFVASSVVVCLRVVLILLTVKGPQNVVTIYGEQKYKPEQVTKSLKAAILSLFLYILNAIFCGSLCNIGLYHCPS